MPAPPRALRFDGSDDLVKAAAERLVARLVELQGASDTPQVGLSGDPLAYRVLAAAIALMPDSPLDPTRLALWWTDDAFLPTDSTQRHALRMLSLLAGNVQLDPAIVHPIPSADAYPDPEAAAHQYAQDLGQTRLDICLLELGRLGQVAGLFPGQRLHPTNEPVVGVTDAPNGPPERVSLSLAGLNAAREIWLVAAGQEVAGLVAASLAGASNLPSANLAGQERTWWFLDQAAASLLPFHRCTL
ncbi:MAG: 6-phosphogluconolactonase [Propionibacteriaceae bacterium]|jgi:6-phosphogluconolactonase|nr:6-phosphogluconolactonase [Propionibacteriaceae bacterium]